MTYTINDNKSITCKQCGMTSHSKMDVFFRWCENCKIFHEPGLIKRLLYLHVVAVEAKNAKPLICDDVSYDREFIEELRNDMIVYRDAAISENHFNGAVVFSHVIAILQHHSEILEDPKGDSDPSRRTNPDNSAR